jgi:hypothetical protein
MKTVWDFAGYVWRLVWNAVGLGTAFVGGVGLIVKGLVPPTRRPPILDAPSWVYLMVLALGFVIAAYRLDRDLRAKISTERRVLVRELTERLVKLKVTIERRNRAPIPIDQILGIQGLAKDLGDEYVIAECEETKNILQRNYDTRDYILQMFGEAEGDYDAVRAKVDHVLKHLAEVS